MTGGAKSRFRVKGSGNGSVSIICKPHTEGLNNDIFSQWQEKGLFRLDLVHGTPVERAEEIANYLNRNVKELVYTDSM